MSFKLFIVPAVIISIVYGFVMATIASAAPFVQAAIGGF